jgi:hypothetical protein
MISLLLEFLPDEVLAGPSSASRKKFRLAEPSGSSVHILHRSEQSHQII